MEKRLINVLKLWVQICKHTQQEMSYSMILDKKTHRDHSRNLTIPKKVRTWTDERCVQHCYNCKNGFGIFVRKHHCRLCGQVFCHKCSDYFQIIPSELLSEESKKGTWNDTMNYFGSYVKAMDLTKYRVCIACNELIEQVNAVRNVILNFINWGWDLPALKVAAQTCRLWNKAANYVMSLFREIQYKLPTDDFTDLERKLLRINAKYVAGHSKYTIALMKIAKTETELKEYARNLSKNKKKS